MDEKQIKNLKINRVTYLVFGIIFILFGLLLWPFLLVGGILIFLSVMANKEYKKALNTQVTEPEPVKESPYIFLRFKVAGVTFKDGLRSRQATLRAFKWGDETPETVDFGLYEYEGKPAVKVRINYQIIGNIPADTVETFLEYEKLYKRDNIHCDIYGGNKLDDGSRTNYGCEIIIRYLRDA